MNFFSIILGSERYSSAACLISSEEYFVATEGTTIGSEICSPFLAPKKLLLPLSYRVAWDEGCPVTAHPSQCVIVFEKEDRADVPEITDEGLKEGSRKNKKCSGQSLACEESQGEKKLTLEELKKLSPPGCKEFEAAVGSKDVDEETALQLWEDIFKPLDIFELLNIV